MAGANGRSAPLNCFGLVAPSLFLFCSRAFLFISPPLCPLRPAANRGGYWNRSKFNWSHTGAQIHVIHPLSVSLRFFYFILYESPVWPSRLVRELFPLITFSLDTCYTRSAITDVRVPRGRFNREIFSFSRGKNRTKETGAVSDLAPGVRWW